MEKSDYVFYKVKFLWPDLFEKIYGERSRGVFGDNELKIFYPISSYKDTLGYYPFAIFSLDEKEYYTLKNFRAGVLNHEMYMITEELSNSISKNLITESVIVNLMTFNHINSSMFIIGQVKKLKENTEDLIKDADDMRGRFYDNNNIEPSILMAYDWINGGLESYRTFILDKAKTISRIVKNI